MPNSAINLGPAATSPAPELFYFDCQHCQHRLSATVEYSGFTAPCPTCHGMVTAPDFSRLRLQHDEPMASGSLPPLEPVAAPVASQTSSNASTTYEDSMELNMDFFNIEASHGGESRREQPPEKLHTLHTSLGANRLPTGAAQPRDYTSPEPSPAVHLQKRHQAGDPHRRRVGLLERDSAFIIIGRRVLLGIFLLGVVSFALLTVLNKVNKDIPSPRVLMKTIFAN